MKTNRYSNNNNNCDNKCSIYWVAGCCSGAETHYTVTENITSECNAAPNNNFLVS